MKFSLWPLLAALLAGRALAGAPPPNFVVILGEGHGWSSTSVAMDDTVPASKSAFVRTPNLEKLAAEGMRFANFYAASPRCTPTRAALLTGKSPARLHMTFVGEGKRDGDDAGAARWIAPDALLELPSDETTIAELLKGRGYVTAHFGKWHLGKADPAAHGFDESDGPTNNGGPDQVDNPHPKELFGMTGRGIAFLRRQVAAGKPFYLQLSHYASRQGGGARPESLAEVARWGGTWGEKEKAAAAADLDWDSALGMLLDELETLGIAGNTYVLFTTDHGTPGKNPPFSGGKGTVSEGGLRVPFIIRGPGIRPGVCCRVMAGTADLFPTIAELAGVAGPPPDGIEGGSLVPALLGRGEGAPRRPREEFVVHFPHYDKDSAGPASAIWLGDLKLVRLYETGTLELYDIARDPAEQRDLAPSRPEETGELARRLDRHLAEVGAQMPSANPAFDPSRPPEPRGPDRPRRAGRPK